MKRVTDKIICSFFTNGGLPHSDNYVYICVILDFKVPKCLSKGLLSLMFDNMAPENQETAHLQFFKM